MLLLARIDEVFPLHCSTCGDAMRIIAFITDRTTVHRIRNTRVHAVEFPILGASC